MSGLDKYKLPREQVDVEAIAQEIYRYLRIGAEDNEFLSYDPTRRDAITAELYAHPDCKPSFWPDQVVGADLPLEKYDEYLAKANTAIERLTPPQSLEDRVMRSNIAFTALLVFQQYKEEYALLDHYDLAMAVMKRSTELMDEWHKNEYPRLFPDRAEARKNQSTDPKRVNPPLTCRSRNPNATSVKDIREYFDSPHTLLGKRFQHSPPPGEEQDYKGTWEMESYSTRMREGRVEHEFQILLEAFDGAPLPMSREEVEFLLKYSTPIA